MFNDNFYYSSSYIIFIIRNLLDYDLKVIKTNYVYIVIFYNYQKLIIIKSSAIILTFLLVLAYKILISL